MIIVRWQYEDEDRLRIENFDTKAQAQRWIKTMCKPREGETRLLIVDATGGIKIPTSCKAPPKVKSKSAAQLQREIDEAMNRRALEGVLESEAARVERLEDD
jgi:hypothetical protein